MPLQRLDLVERAMAEPSAEAHVHEQLEHGAPQERPDRDGLRLRLKGGDARRAEEACDERLARPPPRRREEADAGTVGGEVTADEAPVEAVGRGVDVAGAEERVRLGEQRAVGEGDAVPDEDAVREAAVGDEDERGEEVDGDDGAVARVQVPEQRGQVEDRSPQGQEFGEEYQRRWSRGKAALALSI